MANVILHKTQSAKPASSDPTKMGSTEWNQEHLFGGGSDGQSLVYDSAASDKATWAERARILTTTTTSAGTPASTTKTDLWTYSLPANTLNANGRMVRVTAWGTYAANGNAKTVTVEFGATTVATRANTLSGVPWRVTAVVMRTGASTQEAIGGVTGSGQGEFLTSATPAETLSGAVSVKVTGQNGTASANDIVFRGAFVELLN